METEGGKARREETRDRDGDGSGVVTLRRLWTLALRIGGRVAAGRFRVTTEGGVEGACSLQIYAGLERRRDAGVQESGISREEEDKGEEKGERDGCDVPLRGVDVHPK
jgi:hypothetical protein